MEIVTGIVYDGIMDQFWQFMNSTGFALTAFGAFVGYLSWRGGRETKALLMKIQESITEGNGRLERSISEGNERLARMIEQSERSIEESRRSTQTLIQNWQSRWEQSDEFNKRMLDKILDKAI